MKNAPKVCMGILGAVGLSCGFLGPLILSPQANQGPLLGIFISGPGGALLGLILGVILTWLRASARVAKRLLITAGLALACVTLYASTPAPRYVGRIVDAEVADCAAPATEIDPAIARWDSQVARVTWATARAGWKEDLRALAAGDGGVVLQMRLVRERLVYENQKPWNRGTLLHTPWHDTNAVARYYARFGGADCTGYSGLARALYFASEEMESAPAWPPRGLANLLGLLVLQAVPPKYVGLTQD